MGHLQVSVALDLVRGLEKMVSHAKQCCPACASFNTGILLYLELKTFVCTKPGDSKEK